MQDSSADRRRVYRSDLAVICELIWEPILYADTSPDSELSCAVLKFVTKYPVFPLAHANGRVTSFLIGLAWTKYDPMSYAVITLLDD